MNSVTGITLTLIVLIVCITVYNLYSAKLQRELGEKDLTEKDKERQLVRDMAGFGYVQVPVLKSHCQEAFNDKDNYGDGEDRVTNERSWQLAWVPKDQAEMMLLVAGVDNEDAADLIQEALRPT